MASGIFQKASRCFWSSSSWFSACLISTEAQHVQSTTRSSSQEQNFGVFRRRRPIRLARARSSVADGGASGAFKNLAWAANAAIIQRAPSRLYRLHDHQQPPSRHLAWHRHRRSIRARASLFAIWWSLTEKMSSLVPAADRNSSSKVVWLRTLLL